MNRYQSEVTEFHRALGITIGESPMIRRPELRAELIREESKELRKAIIDGDILGAIDGMCDVIVVTLGSAVEFGIDLDPFWDEVHRTNMAKRGGPVRADGKRLKPKGWTPPDLERVYREVYGLGSA
jgi:predicted HAD superfamily Cof-like phosphohydrolase